MEIVNRCGHPLDFFRAEDCETVMLAGRPRLVAKGGAAPYLTVPSSGALSVGERSRRVGSVGPVPDLETTLFTVGDPLPPQKAGTVIVVSVKAYTALGERSDLRTILDPVHDSAGRTIGCLALGRIVTA